MNQDRRGFETYSKREKGYALTKKFLSKFEMLATELYGEDFFSHLQFIHCRIEISKDITKSKSLYIPFSVCYNALEKRLIFLEFGKVEDASLWLPIFKTLNENFMVDSQCPAINTVMYWDLLKGTTIELSYEDSFLAPKEKVIITARRIIDLSKR